MTDRKDAPPQLELQRRLHTSAETAGYLGFSEETVRRLNRRKKLRAVPGVRKLFFTTEAIESFLRGDEP